MATDSKKFVIDTPQGQFELKTVIDEADARALISLVQRRAPSGHAYVVFHPPGWYAGGPDGPWFDYYRDRREAFPKAGAHIGYTMFETDRIDPNWAAACNGMDEVWVPTEFNRTTFAASGVDPAKLHVIPLGLEFEQYEPWKVRPIELPGKAGFNFLSVFEWNKRKGYDVLLRAYATEFTSDDDVALFVRTYGYSQAGRSAWSERELREYFLSFCPDPARAPKLTFLLERIPDEDMPALYAACDSFVLPSRGEGWGLPFLEAMAMAKPTIGTRWSGQTEFMSDDNSYLVDVVGLTEISRGDAEYPHEYWGHRMAEPSIEHLRQLMRHVAEYPSAAREKGAYARHDVAGRWTPENAAQKILARMEAHGAPRPGKSEAAEQRIGDRAAFGDATGAHGTRAGVANEGGPRGTRAGVANEGAARVIWTAPLTDATGYADEARNFVFGLDDVGTPVRADAFNWSNWKVSLSGADNAKLNRLGAMSVDQQYVRVEHITPLSFVRDPKAKATIGRTMFETDGLPPEWVARCNALDEIWVPTDFNLQTFAAAGVDPKKLRKVNGSFNADQYRRAIEPMDIGLKGRFVFLSVFDFIPRKGWDVLLRAYLEEFRPDENITLVLKAYAADGNTGAQELLARLSRYITDELGYGDSRIAHIQVIVETYAEQDMARLYRAADAYVTATRGEGWGRPIMEAMATGLPCIATNWGGNTEFMHAGNSYLTEYELVDIPECVVANAPWFRGQRWAEPSVAHLRQLMREVFENPTAARKRGAVARDEVLRKYNRPVVARQIARELHRVLGTRPDITPVAWEGSQFVHHSLAHVNREVCLGLLDSGEVDLSIIPYERHQFGPEADPRFSKLQRRLERAPSAKASVHVRHQWPPSFEAPTSGAWVMIQPWEFGCLPAEWIAPMRDSVDEIWVPSNYVRDCYVKSGVPAEKVVVVPNGVDLDTYTPDGAVFPLRTRKKFKFLFVGGTIGRKGIDVLLDTYVHTFTAEDDVCLVIKAVGAKTTYVDSPVAAKIEQLRATPGLPEIEFITDDLSDAEVASLYRAVDALAHPYRGEGFGMPIAEAMACGLPVIVTGYGAALDFCDEHTAYLVPASLIGFSEEQVRQSQLPAASIGYWLAEPDKQQLARTMREVVSQPEQARQVGLRARERMRGYSWQAATERYLDRIGVLAQRTPCRLLPRVVQPMRLEGRRSTAFLHHPSWGTDGWKDVVGNYCRAFTDDDDVTLVLLLDPDQGIAEAEVVSRVGAFLEAQEQSPDVLLVPERVDDVASAYAAVDWLVPSGDTAELERARRHGIRVLGDVEPAAWRAAA
jgi:glycosyltransferase involved in cell wall biosynthesis